MEPRTTSERASSAPPLVWSLETRDVDRLAQAFRRWDHRFDQLGPGLFHGRIRFADLGGVQVFGVETDRPLLVRGGRMPDGFTFSPIESSNADSTWRGRVLRPGMVSVAFPRHEMDHRTNPNYRQTGMSVHRDRLETVSSTLLRVEATDLLRSDRPVQIDPARLASLRRRWRAALRRLVHGQDVVPDEMVADLVRVLAAGRLVDPLHTTPADRRRVVREAEEYALAAPCGAATILDLCRLTGVSERTLYYAFMDARGLSPASYLTVIRLNRARRDLRISGSMRGRVGVVARRHGFNRPGAFASAYRRLFGNGPSEPLGDRYS